jgi:polyhydroxyalkanoate synthase
MPLEPTPKDVLYRDGTASLYRFRRPGDAPGAVTRGGAPGVPVLVVPSLINRWYVLDLRPGGSIVGAFVDAGLDTFCLDWGVPRDEDRYLTWEGLLARLARAIRAVKRVTGSPQVALVGWSLGGTLAGIHTALHKDEVAALCNMVGPFDFSLAGPIGEMADARWFDVDALTSAGNLPGQMMNASFYMLRPTVELSKWFHFFGEKMHDPREWEFFFALEEWAADNVPFPAAAYRTYIKDLYQGNALVQGRHHVGERRVDLADITCPVLTVTAERDLICPPACATALNRASRAAVRDVMSVPGGHVGAFVDARAATTLYPAMTRWFRAKLWSDTTCN